jgi:hypothetical protein
MKIESTMFAAILRKRSSIRMQQVTHRLFYTDMGRILVSLLFGAALAIMCQRACKGQHCLIIDAPPLKDIEPYVFQIGDRYYRYQSRVVACPAAENPK